MAWQEAWFYNDRQIRERFKELRGYGKERIFLLGEEWRKGVKISMHKKVDKRCEKLQKSNIAMHGV